VPTRTKDSATEIKRLFSRLPELMAQVRTHLIDKTRTVEDLQALVAYVENWTDNPAPPAEDVAPDAGEGTALNRRLVQLSGEQEDLRKSLSQLADEKAAVETQAKRYLQALLRTSVRTHLLPFKTVQYLEMHGIRETADTLRLHNLKVAHVREGLDLLWSSLGLESDLDPLSIGFAPLYWQDPEVRAAWNLPVEEALRGEGGRTRIERLLKNLNNAKCRYVGQLPIYHKRDVGRLQEIHFCLNKDLPVWAAMYIAPDWTPPASPE